MCAWRGRYPVLALDCPSEPLVQVWAHVDVADSLLQVAHVLEASIPGPSAASDGEDLVARVAANHDAAIFMEADLLRIDQDVFHD